MEMKSFMFPAHKVNPYVRAYDDYACSEGSCPEELMKMDKIVNDFCKGRQIVSIQKTSHCQGNNPPTYFIDITVLYK